MLPSDTGLLQWWETSPPALHSHLSCAMPTAGCLPPLQAFPGQG